MLAAASGTTHYWWRAVDRDGHVLDPLVPSRRDKAAAARSFRTLLTGLPDIPRVLITDTLARDGAEHAHQPARERERRMRRSKGPGQA